jgi:hypothetical protein
VVSVESVSRASKLGLGADIAQKPNFEARRGQSRQC